MHHATLTTFQFPALISVSVFRSPFKHFLYFSNSIWKLLKESFLIALAAAAQGGPFFVWQLQFVNNNHWQRWWEDGTHFGWASITATSRKCPQQFTSTPAAPPPPQPSSSILLTFSGISRTYSSTISVGCSSVCLSTELSVSQSDCLPRSLYISENSQQIALSAWKKCRWLINK